MSGATLTPSAESSEEFVVELEREDLEEESDEARSSASLLDEVGSEFTKAGSDASRVVRGSPGDAFEPLKVEPFEEVMDV